MPKKQIRVAICYDFDGTLSPHNMQDYDFMKYTNQNSKKFWKSANDFAKLHKSDPVSSYMYCMVKAAQDHNTPFRYQDLKAYGKNVALYPGVEKWFSMINTYGKTQGIEIKHYIISSGLKEMLEGTKIAKEFKQIYASSFIYDNNSVPFWPATVVNYTEKTQYLFRINKGCEDITDNSKINQYVKEEDRPIPFEHMIYIGDGSTDIPCMKMVKVHGGHSIVVYRPKEKGGLQKVQKLIKEDRVCAAFPADYSEGKKLAMYVKSVVDKIAKDNRTRELAK